MSVYGPSETYPEGVRFTQLATLVEMRRSGVPLRMLRHNQVCLWALRQRHLHPEYDNITEIFPGWRDNYRKFVMIHFTGGHA